jgi:hypothetical protein
MGYRTYNFSVCSEPIMENNTASVTDEVKDDIPKILQHRLSLANAKVCVPVA